MIDVQLLRKEPDRVKQAVAAKNGDPGLIDRFLNLDYAWAADVAQLDLYRQEQNKREKKPPVDQGGIDVARRLKQNIKELEKKVDELGKDRDEVWAKIPNLPSEDTPVGRSEEDNKVLRSWGEPTKFSAEGGSASGGDFTPKDHVALGEALGIIDSERAGKISGTRFAYLMGDLVLFEFALVRYAFDVLGNSKILKTIAEKVAPGYSAKPFKPVLPPVFIRPEVFHKMARLEPKDDRYFIPSDNLYLIGSAEHTLGPFHMNETLAEAELPLRYAGFSTSFRREAGSYGKDTKGILRLHQFDKVEMESFTTAEHSYHEQDFFVGIQEYLMQSLNIPYRVVICCTADQGDPDARHIDIEAWLPGQPSTGSGQGKGKYRETHSADLTTDYQSRRLGTRVRRLNGETELAHMNDATVFAIGRTLVAIMENYQTADGKVRVPKVLVKYVGKDVIG